VALSADGVQQHFHCQRHQKQKSKEKVEEKVQ
jgi:hypothetical protein